MIGTIRDYLSRCYSSIIRIVSNILSETLKSKCFESSLQDKFPVASLLAQTTTFQLLLLFV